MKSEIEPFLAIEGNDRAIPGSPIADLRHEFVIRSSSAIPADEQLGLDRLATAIDTTRQLRDVGYRELALSAEPKPFNPTFLRLMSMSLIRRAEITDEVFSSLAGLLQVEEKTLRGMFQIEETLRPEGFLAGVFAKMRSPGFRIVAPIDSFASMPPRAHAAATLGKGQKTANNFRSGECLFEETGFRVEYRESSEGLFVTIEPDPAGASRVPGDLSVTVVSAEDGSPKAGPFGFQRGRADCGRINLGSCDRLVIQGGRRD